MNDHVVAMKRLILPGFLLGVISLVAMLFSPGARADGASIAASVVIAPSGKHPEVMVESNEAERYECAIVLEAQTSAGTSFFGEYTFTSRVTVLPGGQQTLIVGSGKIDPSIPGLAYKTAQILSTHCEVTTLATDARNCGRIGHDCAEARVRRVRVSPQSCRGESSASKDSRLTRAVCITGAIRATSMRGSCTARRADARCKSQQLASGVMKGEAVQLGPDDVFFGAAPIQVTSRKRVYTCPKTGCSTTPTILFGSGSYGGAGNEIVAVGNRWFASFGGGLVSCLFARGQPCEPRANPAAEVRH